LALRDLFRELFACLFGRGLEAGADVLYPLGRPIGLSVGRADCIDRDTRRCGLKRQCARHAYQCVLLRRVRRQTSVPLESGGRGDVYDAPHFRSIIFGNTCCEQRTAPRTFTRKRRSQSAGAVFSKEAAWAIPALFTRMSRSLTFAKACVTLASSIT